MGRPTWPGRLVAVALAFCLAACGSRGDDEVDDGASASSRGPSAPATARDDGVFHLEDLPDGAPPEVDYLADGMLRLDGRTIETDFDFDDATYGIGIEGSVRGTAVVGDVSRYWTIDPQGRTRRLGKGEYYSYDYSPILVPETGHLWVYYSDRGTAEIRIWELDVATGTELAELTEAVAPAGLAPADQAVFEVFSGRRPVPPDPETVTSPDGAWVARLETTTPEGYPDSFVRVSPADDEGEDRVFRFALDGATGVAISTTLFEDDTHLLMKLSPYKGPVTNAKDIGELIVRCDLELRCEQASPLGVAVALGNAMTD